MKISPHQLNGVAFLVLVTAAWLLGMSVTFSFSFFWGWFNMALIIVSFVLIIGSYCTKCPARKKCSHILPGMLTEYLPERKTEEYKIWETVTAFGSMAAMTVFPLYWLFQTPLILVIFVVLIITAVILLRMNVCSDCNNIYCILKVKK